MIENDYSEIYRRETLEFVTVAKEFVAFMESAKDVSKEEFIDTSIKILPLLYLKGVLLPDFSDENDEYLEKFVDENTWSYIQNVAFSKLEEDDEYVQINDSAANTLDDINVPLSELFADIYQEMADLMGAFRTENDNVMQAALYCCKYNFSTYWGIRLLKILNALHEIKFTRENDEI